jgi:hypothetical protein
MQLAVAACHEHLGRFQYAREPNHDNGATLRVAEPERDADEAERDDTFDVGGSAGDGAQLNW